MGRRLLIPVSCSFYLKSFKSTVHTVHNSILAIAEKAEFKYEFIIVLYSKYRILQLIAIMNI